MDLIMTKNLQVSFRQGTSSIKVVRGVDLNLRQGEILGLIGESGSGKSVTATSLMKLIEGDVGILEAEQLVFDGNQVLDAPNALLKNIRGKRVAYIFQNPIEALSPNVKIGKQFLELIRFHEGKGGDRQTRLQRVRDLLTDVGLDEVDTIMNRYAHQLSGGQAQRVVIALALTLNPDLIIADEPTSSVDASLRGLIVALLKSINEKRGVAMLIITHDFEVAMNLCNRVMVMYGGLVVEVGHTERLFKCPKHPYTNELLKCLKSLKSRDKVLYTLEGAPLEPQNFSSACPFVERCSWTKEICFEMPRMREVDDTLVRCHYPIQQEQALYEKGCVV